MNANDSKFTPARAPLVRPGLFASPAAKYLAF
jgi:hypothetical protein